MRIIGIDPGTALTGYAVLDVEQNTKPKLVDPTAAGSLAVNAITTPSDMDMHDRLNLLFKELSNICAWYKPEIMVIERLFFNTNVKTAMSVGQARGIPLLVASRKKIKVFEYTAPQAKKVLANNGRANKKEMQTAVMEYLGLKEVIKPDDANDAVAMALCFYHLDFENL